MWGGVATMWTWGDYVSERRAGYQCTSVVCTLLRPGRSLKRKKAKYYPGLFGTYLRNCFFFDKMQFHKDFFLIFPLWSWSKPDTSFLKHTFGWRQNFLSKWRRKPRDKWHRRTVSCSEELMVPWKRDARHCILFSQCKRENSYGPGAAR